MSVETAGFSLVSGLLSAEECGDLRDALGAAERAGRRGILGLDAVCNIANSPKVLGLIRPLLSGEPRAVRGIFSINRLP